MNLTGHHTITTMAMNEYLSETGAGKGSFQAKQMTNLTDSAAAHAVKRDIIDVATTGHWSNFAQKHHFMRRFDGQSPYEAWEKACEWIKSNALKHANSALDDMRHLGFQYLGYAAHAIEDSFAGGHAQRLPAGGPTSPGDITHVKMYSGHEKDGHEEMDGAWKDKATGGLSAQGTMAKNAVKALIYVIFASVAKAQAAKAKNVTALVGWDTFQGKWLNASSKLSKQRDDAHDLVDDFYTGIVWGNTNHAVSVDEKGLANAIYAKHGVHTDKVRKVFRRLDEYHTADSDDVAHYYVTKLRANPSDKVTKAVLNDKALIKILTKVLDEGWTTDDEQACIDFLNKSGS